MAVVSLYADQKCKIKLDGDLLHIHGGYPRFEDFHLPHTAICTRVQLPQQWTAPTRVQLLQLLEYNYIVLRNYSSSGHTGNTSTLSCTATTRHPVVRALPQPYHAPRLLISRLQWLYINYAAHPGASARRVARHAARRTTRRRLLRLAQSRRRLLRLRRAFGCLGTSRGSSRDLSRRSSSTTLPPPRVRVPRHVVRLVTRLVAPLVVDYCASRRLVVDYFASAARPGASALRAARHAARRAARCRLLRVTRLVPRLVVPLVVDNSASRRLVVDCFAYAARPGASAHRAARHTARRAARCRLLRVA
jgi:hypothetical protein